MQLVISEIVSSIQGEGKYTGYPTTFVRLHGCNLNCSFCDTKYANTGKKTRMGLDKVLEFIFRMGNSHVCITGGEPLLQEDVYCLIYDLVDRNYKVTIETNGAVPIDDTGYKRSFSYCMDIKCLSSGMNGKNKLDNLGVLMSQDEVKCVIKDYDDYMYAKNVLKVYPTRAQIILSPCFSKDGKHNASDIIQWMQEEPIVNSRLGVQMHKLLNIY